MKKLIFICLLVSSSLFANDVCRERFEADTVLKTKLKKELKKNFSSSLKSELLRLGIEHESIEISVQEKSETLWTRLTVQGSARTQRSLLSFSSKTKSVYTSVAIPRLKVKRDKEGVPVESFCEAFVRYDYNLKNSTYDNYVIGEVKGFALITWGKSDLY